MNKQTERKIISYFIICSCIGEIFFCIGLVHLALTQSNSFYTLLIIVIINFVGINFTIAIRDNEFNKR